MTLIVTILGAWALGTMPAPDVGDVLNPQASASTPAGPKDRPDDQKAIQAVTDAFVEAYKEADSKAVAAKFHVNAEVIDVDGTRYEGRDVIEKQFAETFADSPGVAISVTAESLRFLGPDAAKEEGRSTVTPKTGAPVSRRYTVLFTKRDGKWLYDSVREDAEPEMSPHDRLKELEWLVGDWVDESSDADVHVGCIWSDDGNYLLRKFTLKRRGRSVMTVSQRIGWDPLTKQFKSWEFDSEGGYGEALWALDGKRWIIKQSGVLTDGRTASATRIMVQDSPSRVSWVSTQEVVGGEAVPDSDVYVMVKTPPAPRVKTEAGSRTTTPARKPQ